MKWIKNKLKTTIASNILLVAIILHSCNLTDKSTTSLTEDQDYPIQPVLFTKVKFEDEFWAPRIKTNHEVTIPFTLGKIHETGRVKNFQIAAGLDTGKFCSIYPFDDSDVFKILEGASYTMQLFNDLGLDSKVDSLIDLIGKAQEPDGYLYTNRTILGANAHEWAGDERWVKTQDLSHELYNIGHLLESAVAHYYATGKRNYLNIAIKAADLICKDFGPGKLSYYPGHQILELAMAKLYRVTGEMKYLEMAQFLLDVRGPDGTEYNQAHAKVIDQTEAVGHAVRGVYMYAGMADVAALRQEQNYISAIDKIWEDVVSKKMYITGGIGSTGHGEAFGKPYELPNMSAYCETCAAIGNVYWNHRLFMLHGDSKYYDVLERTLYNGLISGVSMEGDKFFYPNPLESHGQHERSPWFGCACCPSNVARFIPSVPGYFYAKKDDDIYINLFAAGTAEVDIKSTKVLLKQETNYPWDGQVNVFINPNSSSSFTVKVRIPGWALEKPVPSDLYRFADERKELPEIYVNGKQQELTLDKGYVSITRKWKKEDKIELKIPMPIRKILAHELVEADRGRMAIQRGPLLYCAEWPDQQDKNVLNLMMDKDATLTSVHKPDLLNGIVALEVEGKSVKREGKDKLSVVDQKINLVPYYSWSHRGSGEMMVWIPYESSAAKPLPAPTIASKSQIAASTLTKAIKALNDQMEPKSSQDKSIIYYHWWPKKDQVEWVQYDFEAPEKVSSSKIYWYDDGPFGGCRIPDSYVIKYKAGDKWVPVKNRSGYSISKDKFDEVKFDAVTTTALRMEIKLPKEFSAGIMEWIVE
jgi:uncharacterized protein